MASLILDFLMAVFLARLVFWLARLFLTSGQSQDGAGGQGGVGRDDPWASGPGVGTTLPGRHGRALDPRAIDRSSAIDVPFTEIPPEDAGHQQGTDVPHHDLDTSEHDTDIRSAAGDR